MAIKHRPLPFGAYLAEPHFSLKHRMYLRAFGRPFAWAKGNLVLKAMEIAPGDRILDVACRHGTFVAEYAARGAYAAGIDINPSILGDEVPVSIRTSGRVALSRADAMQLPFRSGSFDKASILDCLEHFQNDKEALVELRRVMRRSGKLVVAVPTVPGYPPHRVFARLIPLLPKRFLTRGRADGVGNTLDKPTSDAGITLATASEQEILRAFGHYRHYDEPSLGAILGASGFRVSRMVRFQKLFESEMLCLHMSVHGFGSPMLYPVMRMVSALDHLLPKNYPGVMLLAEAEAI